jgi:hypothetical protein
MADPVPNDVADEAAYLEQLHDIQNRAEDLTEGRAIYSNSVRFNIGANEIFMDFYFFSPTANERPANVRAQRVARLVLPIPVALDISQKLVNGLSAIVRGQVENQQNEGGE